MSDERERENAIEPAVRQRSVQAGDVPERLRHRYYTDGRGGAGLGFYVDALVKTPAFRDQGRKLATRRNDPNAIRDMIAVAKHRNWTSVVVAGSSSLRREAWLASRAAGLEVRGYRPTERDVQELARRQQRAPNRGREAAAELASKIVGAVVRARVTSPAGQQRIVEAAQSRIAELIARGARSVPPTLNPARARAQTSHRERVKGR